MQKKLILNFISQYLRLAKQVNWLRSRLTQFSMFFLFGIFSLQAQTAPHAVSLSFANGLSSLMYKPTIGENQIQWGYQINFSYSCMFEQALHNNMFGFTVGADFSSMKNKYTLSDYTRSYNAVDLEGITYLQKEVLKNYTEIQSVNYLNIPIMFRWEFSPLYIELGPIIGFNLFSTIDAKSDLVKTTGLYGDAIEEFENIPNLGFFTVKNYDQEAKLKLGLNVSAGLEFGYFFDMNAGQIGVSLICQYGLLNLRGKGVRNNFIQRTNSANMPELSVNHIFTSIDPISDESIVKKITPLIVGLKLQYRVKIHTLESRVFSGR